MWWQTTKNIWWHILCDILKIMCVQFVWNVPKCSNMTKCDCYSLCSKCLQSVALITNHLRDSLLLANCSASCTFMPKMSSMFCVHLQVGQSYLLLHEPCPPSLVFLNHLELSWQVLQLQRYTTLILSWQSTSATEISFWIWRSCRLSIFFIFFNMKIL